jgi:hypothetical protein
MMVRTRTVSATWLPRSWASVETKDESKRDMAAVVRMMETCFDSADYKEGRTALMEKRAPRWVGR